VIRCHTCREEIPDPQRAWYEITGWEQPRRQGGTNAVFDRRRTGTVMCDACHSRRKFGGSPQQGGLFDA
jgi:hypothetical protein